MENKKQKYTFIERETLRDIADSIRSGKGTTKEEMPLNPLVFKDEIDTYVDSLRGVIDKSSATYVIIPHGANKIGRKAFENYSSLKSVTIPNTVTMIDTDAFVGCTSLGGIILPNSITHLGGFAFSGCTSMKYVKMPSEISTISDYAFNSCSSCVEYDFSNYTKTTVPELGSKVFQYINPNAKIIVPTDKYEYWLYNSNWVDWTHYIVSIGQAKVNTTVPNSEIWLPGRDTGNHALNTGGVWAYCQKNGGSATSIDAIGNNIYGLELWSENYNNGCDYQIRGDATFTEPGTYEIWVENSNGVKVYRRILEVS